MASVIAEMGVGQFETNLHHRADAVLAGDQAILLKRLIRGTARAEGWDATFMAKPYADQSGSGLHVHVSLGDRHGNNIFADPTHGERVLRHAIGGMQKLMPESLGFFAPNHNSFRRFGGLFAPVNRKWGEDNRTVALRIPSDKGNGRRIEHRLAGADANPHLALAVVLAAAHHGITNRLDPGKPVTGNGYAETADADSSTATNWFSALDAFDRSAVLRDYLGDRFVDMFVKVKRQEQARFFEIVPSTDIDWYLLNA